MERMWVILFFGILILMPLCGFMSDVIMTRERKREACVSLCRKKGFYDAEFKGQKPKCRCITEEDILKE